MLFNSFSFALFLPVVFVLYWFVANKSLKAQNLLLLFSSYFFYGSWDFRFLFLLIFSTVLDYYTGIRIHESHTRSAKKKWLWLSILVNLGFLGVFKYYNFFITSFAEGLLDLGFEINVQTLNVILPVGISFYTFHGLSYVIDIFHGRISPEKNFVNYSVFVSFFPLLVAGPIERATHLLPQIQKPRSFIYAKGVDGLKQILWGLFKKIVIADNCAQYANLIFDHPENYSGGVLILGAVFFAFQIYCDFSGYSDIALGTARLFGIELLRNFAFPYFSRDIGEFWRRWHISLSSWFRDYVYIPLGGSKGGNWMKVRNIFVIFLLSGLWHGANWTFIVWGGLNALYFLPLILTHNNRNNLDIVAKGRSLPSFKDVLGIAVTFTLTLFAWIFFRAENLVHAVDYIQRIPVDFGSTGYLADILNFFPENTGFALPSLVALFLIIEWKGREQLYALENFAAHWRMPVRWAFYYSIVLMIFLYGGQEQEFIYFQF